MVKTFRRFEPDQVLLMPPSLADWLPEGHLARFVAELVDEVLDLGPDLRRLHRGAGVPPNDPRLMVRLLVYGYTTRVRSAATGREYQKLGKAITRGEFGAVFYRWVEEDLLLGELSVGSRG